ncbi:unnamed protein product [Triticum turgidum subsp. durum]|uniref:KIB1-4 beta-propeller domain-containing protein n=1 Tax=Triticum turgidum subsp. durum TaxID=4567 RepID=A0A9R1S8Y4_TRITD|nr:unnamed protein product [Triticum turgidum subsp. durum]
MLQELDRAAMAAVPSEVPTPLASTILLPAKRVKQDPSCREPSSAVPAMEAAGWSTLSGDLVRRIADSFLANNDLDYYMSVRGVCPTWRATTDDSSSDTRDSGFHPHTWIVLDEDFQRDGRRVLLNTLTGRFLRKKLPVLLDYYIIGTSRGFFVLADRSPPHAACVFNPLTGCVVRFAAPVPREVGLSEVDSLLALALFCDSSRTIYKAAPDSERFIAVKMRSKKPAVYDCFRKAAVGGVYAEISALKSIAVAEMITFLPMFNAIAAQMQNRGYPEFPSDLPRDVKDIQSSLVVLSGQMLIVLGAPFPFVCQVDIDATELEPLVSIGRFAIFISNRRCLAVDTDMFPSIEANCVYFIQLLGSSAYICKSNIEDRKVQRISESPDFVKRGKRFVLVACRPFTVIQLLSSYTINIPDSQLALQQMP